MGTGNHRIKHKLTFKTQYKLTTSPKFSSMYLSVIMKNENELNHMCVILDHFQKYCTCDVKELTTTIVNKFVIIVMENDDLYLYTRELLTLVLIWHNYYDSVKEGDRVLDLWKFLLLIFKKAKQTNYSKEAFILLVHSHIISPDCPFLAPLI